MMSKTSASPLALLRINLLTKGLPRFGLLVLALSITACVSMPISSMWKLRNLDMLNTEPEDLRIAVITDKIMQLNDGSTSLTIAFSSKQAEHNFSYRLLTTIEQRANVASLASEISDNQTLTLFYLSDKEAEQLRLAQNRMRAVRDQDIDGNGSLSISVHTGCFTGPQPDALLTTIYAQFDLQQGFIKMQSNIDLMEMSEQAEQQFWLPCES